MKKIAIFLSLIIFISCNTDDDAGDVITNEFDQIEIILPQGKWEITNFFYEEGDHTEEYVNFIFSFTEDGTVEGKTDLYTETGTWDYISTSGNGEQLILQFEEGTPFDEITFTWNIISLGISKVELAVNNNGDHNTRLLTITKLQQ